MRDAVAGQREYYARTAGHYDAMHLAGDDEHGIALAAFAGLAARSSPASILDVGAGTGRALEVLAERLPGVSMLGVEPVAALRAAGHARGIAESQLIDGDALALDFADNSFDFVIETGVLHHVPDPARAVAEMVRVARLGVMISDSNKYGQGSRLGRAAKAMVRRLGLWNAMIWLQTRGRMFKESEGDGIYFSYSLFDNVAIIRGKFPRLHMLNTLPCDGFDLRQGSPHAVIFATRHGTAIPSDQGGG